MRKLVDLSGPDGRRGTPNRGPTCSERVKHTRSVPPFGEGLDPEPEPTLFETDTPIRGVHWSNEYNTRGARHASGSRSALDYQPAAVFVPPARARAVERARSARLAPRALARAKSDK